MADSFKRILSTDVTDALMLAMEHAGSMDTVLVVYLAKEGEENSGGFVLPKGTKLETVLWMVETFKQWLLNGAIGLNS